MYNSDTPKRAQLPSSAQLIKSTFLAIIAAIAILITIVLPAEYGIDPTGTGKMLNLVEMGEIKQQLAAEAEADRQMELENNASGQEESSSLIRRFLGMFVASAHAQTSSENWTDEQTFTLKPSEGIEIKLVMEEGAQAQFRWVAVGGVLNYDLHGDGSGKKIRYQKARAKPSHEGTLTAAFSGNHGWFWRNRDKQDVTVTLSVKGAYSDIIRP